jgi:hypothetical protein
LNVTQRPAGKRDRGVWPAVIAVASGETPETSPLFLLPYEFTAPVKTYDFETYAYTVVYLPEDLAGALPLDRYRRLRVEAEVNGVPLKAALMPTGGRWYLMLSKKLLKRAGLTLGDPAHVTFAVADQDAVDVLPPLAEALDAEPDLRAAWEALTPGKRRGLAHRVASAKTAPTIAKRVAEVIDGLV